MTDTSLTSPGTLYGLGIGPGDPELLTLKALRYLQSAPVVAFPAGQANQIGVAQRAIAQWLSPQQVQLPLQFPYVQDQAALQSAWQQAANQVWQYLKQGQDVVFASEGDISFYSTFTYLAQTLHQRHPQSQIRAVPGVCSPLAAAAVLSIPLTIGSQRLAVLPALYSTDQIEEVLAWADVVVLMKVSSVYAEVWPILQRHQLLERSFIVENATRSDQVIYAGLSQHQNLKLPYFSLLIVQVDQAKTL
ncbi:MAG: precorrin-2 C(20)-methyltransferase [Leptolyngbyaceae cyanobacterium SM1_1_3]|nr:precorrin-2 C(20)-methyltransferase [Leptolyngbyaceae cyanobacterium SM1_1_3]NJN03258.1 precorrin-2 C(20)-methyltransferase [Leptolyngbyaceae cyanobacterium RM1_1_2]NJO11208.1 precorrin-2 C(20)-methyltransferase [Leptolyngbyaceae cyanobacterium SL_1_1]